MSRNPTIDSLSSTARRVTVCGIVQGVGFRPFVFRLAKKLGIAGWVRNSETGVEIHAEAAAPLLQAFLRALSDEMPQAADIATIRCESAPPQGYKAFEILESHRRARPTTRISPDLCVCQACLRELSDPADRRHEYPYINCTNCGPRYSITHRLPYDRANTSMADWPLCTRCRAEYDNPLDRRYHAQPTACPECGPGYQLMIGRDLPVATRQRAIFETARRLRDGQIVAIKGIGGYHLACDARNAQAVAALRTRKFRKEKPFALMVRDLETAKSLVHLSPAHERLLCGAQRPIVLADARIRLDHVAPDHRQLGIMLPYAPLHHLLFDQGMPNPVVLTSANRSSEPIAYRDEEAFERLEGIADAWLVGERPIVRRIDDSVVAVQRGKPFMIRRARGYAPAVVAQLPTRQPLLALGADLKNSIALVVEGQAIVSQHIGDLDELETLRALETTVRDLLDMYDVSPHELTVICDRHPQFASVRVAHTLGAQRVLAVQHHRAHLASVLAEHEIWDETVVGAVWDGTGWGDDETIWGSEFFVGSLRQGFIRCCRLMPVPMPGGDAAARFPVQAAAGFLSQLDPPPDMRRPPFELPRRFDDACRLVARRVRCFRSTSAGRLFDTVAALLGFHREVSYEGQAAIWLENLAWQVDDAAAYHMPHGPTLDPRPLLQTIIAERVAGRSIETIARAFHETLAWAIVRTIRDLCQQHGARRAALSGGVFQNTLLVQRIDDLLRSETNIELLTHHTMPPNDGGICLGQAAMACYDAAACSIRSNR